MFIKNFSFSSFLRVDDFPKTKYDFKFTKLDAILQACFGRKLNA